MTKVLLLSLFILVSCNQDTKVVTTSQLGSIREFLQVPVEGREFLDLCLKLGQKADRLPSLSTAGVEYNFSYAQKNCNDSEMGAASDVTLTIDQLGGSYFFKPTGNSNFGFTQIETPTEGVMKEICANATALTSPLQTGSTSAVWFRKVSEEKCRSDANHFCIKLEKGSLDSFSNRYLIHTEELIQFRLTGNNTGFFVKRYLDTAGNCNSGKRIQKEAFLR
ncbi:MAG: hypothetical protein NDI69_00415 [Bacteriovoracaceae bacterium]|nr:hypothetical protein [Bacteriovoracaceae bacterium]